MHSLKLHDITPLTKDNQQYFFSLVEKENESGILFNERLFYLHASKCIGYFTSTKQALDNLNFNDPKSTILISSIKGITQNGDSVAISFFLVDGGLKKWVLRFKYEEVARKWFFKLQN